MKIKSLSHVLVTADEDEIESKCTKFKENAKALKACTVQTLLEQGDSMIKAWSKEMEGLKVEKMFVILEVEVKQ